MSQPYVGEVRIFAGNFAPAGWMFCEGQLLPISEFETLFNLIGTTYGGDGQSTFALPDLRGRLPMHQGNGFTLAETGGSGDSDAHSLADPVAQPPLSRAPPMRGTRLRPSGFVAAANNTVKVYTASPPTVVLHQISMLSTGGSQPHDNFQPYLCVSFIMSMFGIFPSQT
ncbi:Tail Collar domain protein [Chthoniobacter flavus Ellin428]|uniref:Tail Collar domain protein n=1 Tax=Chthoniobacter flavus Ellin428 TaxID=497964 RepID=B4D820_9BACT|nr:tail fiber protein [Chthoniobacter flavus]EDY17374.1 Tail Collar domain protein [Chthoniobacter flavus Ellin428]